MDAMERLAALVVLVLLAPFLIVAALITAILSRQPPLIAHRRLGLGGHPFWMLKLRTMWPRDARSGARFALVERIVDESGPKLKRAKDSRVSSRFARFCRRHSIDELPQLVHVVGGEMSLVGPRPITEAEWKRHYQRHAADVLRVKPGLSGLWQIRGRSRLSYEQRRELDLALVRDRSWKLYFQILWSTLPEVLSGRNAW
jgi:exopolysaccharide production protein ExoY